MIDLQSSMLGGSIIPMVFNGQVPQINKNPQNGPQSILVVKTQHALGLGNVLKDMKRLGGTRSFSGHSSELRKDNRFRVGHRSVLKF